MSNSTLQIIGVAAFLYCLHYCIAVSNETDKLALIEIKAQIKDDPLGIFNSWNHTLHFCKWFGVTCGRRHQRVTMLQLNSSMLTGFVSPFIGNLSFLKELDLSDNNFGGTIPLEIGWLNRLQYLYLGNNTFEGYIPPNISTCTNLVELFADENRLIGWIPAEFISLLNLQYIVLSRNNLTGTIPSWLGNLSSLSYLYLVDNNFKGSIPESISKLKTLRHLALDMNWLSGFVPQSIFNLTSLERIDAAQNFLVGNIPSDLGSTLQNLQRFSINNNNFTGSFPTFISNSSNLQVLQLQNNNFQGHVPSLYKLVNLRFLTLAINSFSGDLYFISSLSNTTNLRYFGIYENNFSGVFPRNFCNFSNLSVIDIWENNIGGEIPTCIENLASLSQISAWSNQLFGVIPHGIGKLQNLVRLDLSYNQLSKHIPSTIGNLTKLTDLILQGNKLKGQIPSTLGNCKNILSLSLSNNQLNGNIPTQFFNLYTLPIYRINFSNNHFIGSLPPEVELLKNLILLDVSTNKLSGEIPSTLSACVGLEHLSMMGNSLHGTIPEALKALKSLRVLDLSRNNLSGKIPQFLASLPLQILDLSYNMDLEGEVPHGGIFLNASGLSIVGNARLCGGIMELKLPRCKFQKPERTTGHKKRMFIIVLFGILGVILLSIFFVSRHFLWNKKSLKKPTALVENSENYPNLSYQNLCKATNEFSSENFIGRGTFGVVYKGILDDLNNSIVAIKIFKLEQHGASKNFMAECKVLRNTRHRNLVQVITVCSSVDHTGNDFKALVYEYMVNGSLQDWLHPEAVDMVQNINHAPRSLNLRQRLDITIDIASALEYLHYHCGTSIVHCDLKPSNVLLDEEMVAHVSDFGLAKFLSRSIGSSDTNQSSSSLGVRGTIGYTPPEYGVGNEVSTRGDAYSFGVLLLEIFTGKKPTDDMFNGISLRHFVKDALPERLSQILDHTLINNLDEGEVNINNVLDGLVSILEIAITCSSELPRERLDMSDVSAQLCSIRSKLLGTHLQRRRFQAREGD